MSTSLYDTVFDGTRWSEPVKLLDGTNPLYADIAFPHISSSATPFDAADLFGTYRINTERQMVDPDTGRTKPYPIGTQCLFAFIDKRVTRAPVPIQLLDGAELPLADVSGKLEAYDGAVTLFYKRADKFFRCVYNSFTGRFLPWLELGSGIATPYPPAPAWYRGRTHLFAIVENQNLIDHWANTPSQPDTFTKQTEIKTEGLPQGLPAAAIYGSMLCLAYYTKDAKSAKTLRLRRYDGANWSPELTIYPDIAGDPGIAENASRPSLSAMYGLLYCFYVKDGGTLAYRTYNGHSVNNRSQQMAASPAGGDIDTAVRWSTTRSDIGVKTTTALLHCIYLKDS